MDTKFLHYRTGNTGSTNDIIDTYHNERTELADYQNPFQSFWMAGFECTDKLNAFGNRVDLSTATGHLQVMQEDYKRLSLFNISTVREGIRWSQVEKIPYQYDWSTVEKMIICGKSNNIQQVWDICHFGFPDDLTPLHPMFARRFASLCTSFAEFYRKIDPVGILIVTPINEVSFLSWLGGDVRGTSPYCVGQGWEVKYRLTKAYIEGIKALKKADPSIRILTTEPLVNMVPPMNATQEQIDLAAAVFEDQFQVTDMLSGRMCPELGGKPEYLDILGYNYYYNNQWIVGTYEFLPWRDNPDKRFVPLNRLLSGAYYRYHRPFVITETSHPKEDRPFWIKMIADQCALLLSADLPLWGVCWYPIIDRPDWDSLDIWHQSGIWDGKFDPDNIERILHFPTATALLKAQSLLDQFFTVNDINNNALII